MGHVMFWGDPLPSRSSLKPVDLPVQVSEVHFKGCSSLSLVATRCLDGIQNFVVSYIAKLS